MAVVVGHDAIHLNVSHLPPGQAAGYTTGSGGIAWTDADWKAHPGAVRICQDSGSDHTADVLDVERGAASNGDAVTWYHAAAASYETAARPGQRRPAIYTSASNVTPLADALIAGGIHSGPGLWVANWNLTDAQAVADVQNAAGPFPIIGVQYHSGPTYDTDVFSGTWLADAAEPGAPGLTWSWYVTDGILSLAGISRELTRAGSPGMTPAHILRATCTKNGGHWDAATYAWLNTVLGDPPADPHQPIPAGAKLWVLQ